MSGLVLSLFPGLDLLGLAMEMEIPGACLVRGPDLLMGKLHDVRRFHPPAGVFWGVVGGPPCAAFSRLRHLNPLAGVKAGNLIPEFERVVYEAQSTFWLMENVRDAPVPAVSGYQAQALVVNNRWFGAAQTRIRRFTFGTRDGRSLDVSPDLVAIENPEYQQAVTRSARAVPVRLVRDGHGGHKPKRTYTENGKQRGPGLGPQMAIADICALQGLPPDMLDGTPFTASGKRLMLGNGVPLDTGRAIARAIARALQEQAA